MHVHNSEQAPSSNNARIIRLLSITDLTVFRTVEDYVFTL